LPNSQITALIQGFDKKAEKKKTYPKYTPHYIIRHN